MPLTPEWQKFIQGPLEKLGRRGINTPQDEPQPPRPPLTKEEKEVTSLLAVARDEQLRRWANDLPLLTQEEQDSLLLKEYRRRKDAGLLMHI